ncbi:MAG: hypothetical protein EXS08_16045 [Planctomycetes bacterium]|nr:hypothetical protein [Planctomycetota bacterium]
MRVVLHSSLGLAVLLASSAMHAQQLKQAPQSVRPTEKFTVPATSFAWSDLVKFQASLPVLAAVEGPAPSVALEPPILDVPLARKGNNAQPSAPVEETPGVQKLLPCAGFVSEPPIGAGFDSQLDVPDGAGFSFIPPDVGGAVGPDHLMTMLENKVLIQDRLGGTVSSVDLNTFWSPLGTTPLSPTTVYPRVYFDALDSRWLATVRNGVTSTGSTSIFFAISETADPLGIWDYYSFLADPGSTSFADWTLIGYNSTWITITANMFTTPAGASFLGSKMWTIDKSTALVAGGPITVNIFPAGFMTTAHGSGGSSVHPARTLDGNPTLWMVNDGFTGTSTFLYQLTQITGTGAAPVVSGLVGSPFGGTTSFCYSGTPFTGTQRTMAQIGEARFITPFSVRIGSVAVRGGKIWVANSGGLPGPTTNTSPTSNGIIWNVIDPTLPFPPTPGAAGFMVVQTGGITNGASTQSMYPSIAVNCAEDVLIGFANGDSTRLPRACYTMRLGTDAPSFMGAINELKAGESTYWKNFGVGTTAQYGRYTSAAVDPNDDRTLWTLQEYADTRVGALDNDSRWGTWWGRLGECEIRPVITDDPDDVVACVGDAVSFTVVASTGTNALTYQWRFNGVDILGATADTYPIAATVPGDAGSYDVIVTGCGCKTSLAATLSFAGAIVGTQPITVNAAVGTPASFFVAATGQGTLTYQWLFNGNPILGATSDTLSIPAVAVADYGTYSCIITDDCGPVTSDSAKLNPDIKSKHQPAELSLHIFEGPQATIGCNGSSASFSVVAYPAGVSYLWRKNGIPIVPPETGSSLVINPVSVGDAGNYSVKVSLGAESVTSGAASLVYSDVPTINVQPSPGNQTVAPGSDVTYTVVASGLNLTYQWKHKPSTPFAPYVNINGANAPTLLLEAVTTADGGTYRCAVSNDCGTVQTIQLKLLVL